METKKTQKFVATRIDTSLAEKVEQHAKEQDLSTSQVIRKLLKEWVAQADKEHRKNAQQSLI
jgi:antitoxin component of RelBE/YafQ-DinJ toxin-antitoxin module